MSANKFKVGDKVKVRKGLVAYKCYGNICCDSVMAEMGGEVFTIRHVVDGGYYIRENLFCWTDEMLEPTEKTLN